MSKRRLFIVGAGGFGREMEMHLSAIDESARQWQLAGFIDDNPEILTGYESDYSVVGNTHDFAFDKNDIALLAIATPTIKKAVFERLQSRVEFFTFISATAIISKFARIGRGCIMGPNTVIGPNVTFGDGVFLNTGSVVGHDVTVGSYTSFMANNNIAGGCTIGEEVYFASSVTMIPNRKICSGALIGAGSVVVRNVTRKQTVFGNPAKYL